MLAKLLKKRNQDVGILFESEYQKGSTFWFEIDDIAQ